MSHEPGRLLESDRLEDVLDEPLPAQPVIVVQYRDRTRVWAMALVLVFFAVLGSLYILHRREVRRLREQALAARIELRKIQEQSEANALRAAGPARTAGGSAADPASGPAPRSIVELGPPGGRRADLPAKGGAGADSTRGAELVSRPSAAIEPAAAVLPPQRGIVFEPANSLPGPEDGGAVAADADSGAGARLAAGRAR